MSDLENTAQNREEKLKKIHAKQELVRAIKYIIFAISAGLIQAIALVVCQEVFKFKPSLSYIIALVLSVLWSFTFNRKFTFKSANNVPIAMIKVACYYLIFAPLSTWWVSVFTAPPYNINEYIIEVATMVINFLTEALFYRFVVFKNSINTNASGIKENEEIEKQLEE